MPTFILPDGSPRWVELTSCNSFMTNLAAFYNQHTINIDSAWDAHKIYLRDSDVNEQVINDVEQYLTTSFGQGAFESYGHLIRGHLIDANAAVWREFIKARTDVPAYIDIPVVLDKIAQLCHNERSGCTGKGEFFIPLLFKGAVWNAQEAIYDVTINGKHWHVKAIKRLTESAKLNRCGYANGQICKTLSRFMSASQLSAGMKQTGLMANIASIRALKWFDACRTDRDIIMHFQRLIDTEMRTLSIADAQGVIFYLEPHRRFIFKDLDDVYCTGATQSNHQVSMQPHFFINTYDKIMHAEAKKMTKEQRLIEKRARDEAQIQTRNHRIEIRLAVQNAIAIKKIQRTVDQKYAAMFLEVLRNAWKLYKPSKTVQPSFTDHLRDFVNLHSLDYEYFYSYLLENSACKKTFIRYNIKCM